MNRKLPFTKDVFRVRSAKIWRLTRSGGFSLLELVIVIVIISALMAVAANQFDKWRAGAERVAMETVVGTLRSAIGINVAETIVKQGLPGLQALQGSNPMDRLAELPKNYLGEFDDPDVSTFERGSWFYDRRSRALVYLPEHVTYFAGAQLDPPRARFTIKLVYADKNKNGSWDVGLESIEGVRLAALEPYRWVR